MDKMSYKDSGLKSMIETLENKCSQEDKAQRASNMKKVWVTAIYSKKCAKDIKFCLYQNLQK